MIGDRRPDSVAPVRTGHQILAGVPNRNSGLLKRGPQAIGRAGVLSDITNESAPSQAEIHSPIVPLLEPAKFAAIGVVAKSDA